MASDIPGKYYSIYYDSLEIVSYTSGFLSPLELFDTKEEAEESLRTRVAGWTPSTERQHYSVRPVRIYGTSDDLEEAIDYASSELSMAIDEFAQANNYDSEFINEHIGGAIYAFKEQEACPDGEEEDVTD